MFFNKHFWVVWAIMFVVLLAGFPYHVNWLLISCQGAWVIGQIIEVVE